MRYKLTTLIDITDTGSRRGEDPIAYRQNQNYQTVLQTLGLRTNIEYVTLEREEVALSNYKFGSEYKGKKAVWTFVFEVEREGYHSVEEMEQDFNLVPIITSLSETAKIDKSVFYTKDSKLKNIVFEAF
jgi:hypothetical protein